MTTRFSIASVRKQFTAFAIMILYDKGLLKLDEKANQYLPSNNMMDCKKWRTINDKI